MKIFLTKTDRIKYILRIIFFLLVVSQLVHLNGKAESDAQTIADFKFKMIEKLRTDSLNSKHKVELLLNDTTKFIENSSPVRRGIRYLIGLITLWAVIELIFIILRKGNYKTQEPN